MRSVSVLLMLVCVGAVAAVYEMTDEEWAEAMEKDEGKHFSRPDLALWCSGEMWGPERNRWVHAPGPDFSILINFKGGVSDHGYVQVNRHMVGQLTRYPDEYAAILPAPGHPYPDHLDGGAGGTAGFLKIHRYTGSATITMVVEGEGERPAFEGTCKKAEPLF